MATPPRKPPPFSRREFGEIAAQWRDYEKGISPTRQPRGRAGQNPRLLQAFAVLAHAESRAERDARKT